MADLPYQHTACIHCARALRVVGVCKECQDVPPLFQYTQAIFSYEYPVNKLIQVAKFNRNLAVLNLLGDVMAHHLDLHQRPDVLIPVPLHPKRLHERGYNQSVELAKRIVRYTQIPLDYTACERCRNTPPQTSLPAKQRKINLKGAFQVQRVESGWQHIAIIDDVMTTGATVNELAEMFLQKGVARVDAWCCARR